MKENNKLAAFSTEELQNKYKKSKAAVIGLGIVMLFALITLIYLAITGPNYSLLAVAIGCSMAFLPSIIALKQMEKEIKSRKSK
jgi:divalent metal cation (Fe/Co/Zn/Cd) transporter